MHRPLPPIREHLDDLQRRLRRERDAERKRRLHALVLIASGQARTRLEIADYLAVSRPTVSQWLNRYEAGGVEAMLQPSQRGAPAEQRTLSPGAYEALVQRLAEPEGFGCYDDIQRWLAEEWGEEVAYQAVHRLVYRRLGVKLKRPRPRHPKKTMPRPPLSPSA